MKEKKSQFWLGENCTIANRWIDGFKSILQTLPKDIIMLPYTYVSTYCLLYLCIKSGTPILFCYTTVWVWHTMCTTWIGMCCIVKITPSDKNKKSKMLYYLKYMINIEAYCRHHCNCIPTYALYQIRVSWTPWYMDIVYIKWYILAIFVTVTCDRIHIIPVSYFPYFATFIDIMWSWSSVMLMFNVYIVLTFFWITSNLLKQLYS